MSIQPIDNASIHRITSGQVVIDLQTAVKELVENSLDAGATIIEVRFKEYGLKGIEVIDNGSGIAEEDHDNIALNHHTSKLTSFVSLTTLTSFGFRGEALSSLCSLCESVSVVTATENRKGVGCKLEMGRRGEVVKKSVVARQRGTTVILTNLFKPLPVRRKEFERNHKREYAKATNLLTAYALIPCSSTPNKTKGVRLTLTNTLPTGKKQTHVLAPGADAGSMAIATGLWGSKSLEGVCEFQIHFDVVFPKAGESPSQEKIQVYGLVSNFTQKTSTPNAHHQFFYINQRPCVLPKIQKTFNELYRSFHEMKHLSPLVVADFVVPGDKVDVNVVPDKRWVGLVGEDGLVKGLREALEVRFGEERGRSFVVGGGGSQQGTMKQTLLEVSSSQKDMRGDEEDVSMDIESAGEDDCDAGDLSKSKSKSKPLFLPSPPASEVPIPSIMTPTASPAHRVRNRQPSSSSKHTSSSLSVVNSSAVTEVEEGEEEEGISRKSNQHKPLVPSSPDPAQLVLDTLDPDDDDEAPPRKKTRTSSKGAKSTGDFEVMRSSVSLRDKLGFFARNRISHDNAGVVDEGVGDEEGVEEAMRRRKGGLRRCRARRDEIDIDTDEGPQPIDVDDLDSVPSGEGCAGGPSVLNDDSEGIPRPEIIRSSMTCENISMRFDLGKISTLWTPLSSTVVAQEPNTPTPNPKPTVGADAGISNTEDIHKAADTLSRVIDKGDFATMDIAGQFNLGFIVVRRRKSMEREGVRDMDDLFIVDQHAADEKYNFERLQESTVIESQKLFRPQPLELTAADEVLAIENIEILRQNGFEVEVEDEDEVGGHRLKLVAQPVSKDTAFDMKDLEELLHLMQDRPLGQMVRCSKARAMFAMRACRKSVMVGTPLTKNQMTSVIQHMGTMDQPWNCPHGRPTMRHVSDIADFGYDRARTVDWRMYDGLPQV